MKRSIKLAAMTAGIGLAALISAGPANARPFTNDENRFLELLNAHGYDVSDYPADYIQRAHWVCYQLNSMTGDKLIPIMLAEGPNPSGYVSTYDDSAIFMWDAITALCPWHDHSGRLLEAT